jgi:putative ABC transport system permease protein
MWTALLNLVSRIRYALARTRMDREAQRELDEHLDLLVDRYVRLGMNRDEARAAARRRFGSPLLVREEIYHMNSIGWLEELAGDARYGLRLLTRNRAFTVVASLTLALGIGATSAIFSVLNAVVFAPLPFRDPARLVWIQSVNDEGNPRNVPPQIVEAWRRESRTLTDAANALMGVVNFTITGPDGAERIAMEQVDRRTLRLLGVEPVLGRTFRDDEVIVQGNSSQALVISYGLWQRLFGGDPAVIGKRMPGSTAGWGDVIAGVMPRGFYTHPARVNTDAWYVLTGNPSGVIARLAPGVTLDQARAELDTVTRTLLTQGNRPAPRNGFPIQIQSLDDRYRADYARTLYMLLGAVACVLLIAAVNVANLQLNRGAARHVEIAARMALGASRVRLLRQLVVENVILVLIGGALGIFVAMAGIKVFVAVAPDFYPPSDEIGIDTTVLLFTAAVCVVTGILSGLAPALRASGVDLQSALRQSGRSADGGLRLRIRRALVVSEVALAMVLLVGAGLMINSYARAMSVDMGVQVDGVVSTRVVLLGMDRYRIRKTLGHWIATPNATQLYSQIIDRLSAAPGVESVAVSSVLPPGNGLTVPFRILASGVQEETAAELHEVSPAFFDTVGIPLRRGRGFADTDHETAPGVVIVNEAFARRFFRGVNPVGQSIQTGLAAPNPALEPDRVREVVGVVADVRPDMREDFEPVMYVPFRQHLTDYPGNFQLAIHTSKEIIVRGSASPAALTPIVRRVVAEADPGVAIGPLISMRERLSLAAGAQSFWMRLLGIFAGLGAFLAAIGIYGVVSYTVQQRTQEFGIRTTLGAQQGDIMKLVLREGAAVTLIGLVLGIGGAFASTRLLQNQLFGVSRMDPVTIAVVAAVLLAIALAACFIPARRTTKLNPLLALRAE